MTIDGISQEWRSEIEDLIDWLIDERGFKRPVLVGSQDSTVWRELQDSEFKSNLPARFGGQGNLYSKRWYDGREILVVYFSLGLRPEDGVYLVDRADLALLMVEPWEWLLKDF